jgi:hypothetical protein
MEVMLFGMVISVRAVHLSNIPSPSTEHPSGITTVFRALLPLKTPSQPWLSPRAG